MVIVVMTPLPHILRSECICICTIQSHYVEDVREIVEPIAAIDGFGNEDVGFIKIKIKYNPIAAINGPTTRM